MQLLLPGVFHRLVRTSWHRRHPDHACMQAAAGMLCCAELSHVSCISCMSCLQPTCLALRMAMRMCTMGQAAEMWCPLCWAAAMVSQWPRWLLLGMHCCRSSSCTLAAGCGQPNSSRLAVVMLFCSVPSSRGKNRRRGIPWMCAPSATDRQTFCCAAARLSCTYLHPTGTIFVYGQTGAGKTYTMDAVTDLVLQQLYAAGDCDSSSEVAITVSAVELYNEVLRCLLSSRENLQLRWASGAGNVRGVVLEGAEERVSGW